MATEQVVEEEKKLLSPCHNARISASLGDGVLIGSCSVCFKDVVRLNRQTGVQEWLDGKSPWTDENLRPVTDDDYTVV